MSEQKNYDGALERPATLKAVVEAVVCASQYNESELADLVSAGRLKDLFPFKPRAIDLPPDFMPREKLTRASALPLDYKARKALIQSSMPAPSKTQNREFDEFVAEWEKDVADPYWTADLQFKVRE